MANISAINLRVLIVLTICISFIKSHMVSINLKESQPKRYEIIDTVPAPNLNRPRRSTSKKLTIQLVVVAEKSMTLFHQDDLENYVKTLISITQKIFHDPSIGQSIDISLEKIMTLDFEFNVTTLENNSTFPKRGEAIDAAELLVEFLNWRQNYDNKTALLLTRRDLCDSDENDCMMAGMAHVGGICMEGRSGLIVEDNGLEAGFSIAHELGHLHGLDHDDGDACSNSGAESQQFNIMSSSNQVKWNPWEWSHCSKTELAKFLNNGGGACLENKFFEDAENSTLPGQVYGMADQCRLFTGQEVISVEDSLLGLLCPEVNCQALVCPEETLESLRCVVWHKLVADGTPCGKHGTESMAMESKWCLKGQCVERSTNVTSSQSKMDGGWGTWSEFDACSGACGGGVRKSRRQCDSPTPKNGGQFCLGDRIKYESCNTMDCPLGVEDEMNWRQEQCSQFNGNNLNEPGVPENVTWVAVPTHILQYFPMNERCKLLCFNKENPRSLFRLGNKNLIDGTKCDPGNKNNFDICVDGQCLPAGCDHVLSSGKSIDACGVCNGKNVSCQTIEKWLNSTMNSTEMVKTLVQIPAGAFQLQVRQYASPSQMPGKGKFHNFLALFDPLGQKYLFNDPINLKIYVNGGKIQGPGIVLEYSGYNFYNENVTTKEILKVINSGQGTKTELILQIFTNMANNQPYHVHYSYVVSSKMAVMDYPEKNQNWNWTDLISNYFQKFVNQFKLFFEFFNNNS